MNVSMLDILNYVRTKCNADGSHSFRDVHRMFEESVRTCPGPTCRSNPSFLYFADWIARTKHLVNPKESGEVVPISLTWWQVMTACEPDDRVAYHEFWRLFDKFCELDEKVVLTSSVHQSANAAGQSKECKTQADLIQLSPEVGVYMRVCPDMRDRRRSSWNAVHYFASPEAAVQFADNHGIPRDSWKVAAASG